MKVDKNELNTINFNSEFKNPEVFDGNFEILLQEPKVVAIGECGLDYSYLKDFSKKDQEKYQEAQKKEFKKQIQIAKKYQLPLSLHVRNLYEQALSILEAEEYKGQGVFHFFTGNLSQAKMIIDKGFLIGLSGVITYSSELDRIIEAIPLKKILIETDAPYVAPIPYRGQRNEPIYVREVAKKIAQIKKLSQEEIERVTFQNTVELFKLQLQ